MDLSGYRLEIAKRLGVDHTPNGASTRPDERLGMLRDLTHGRGADVVVEYAGVRRAIDSPSPRIMKAVIDPWA